MMTYIGNITEQMILLGFEECDSMCYTRKIGDSTLLTIKITGYECIYIKLTIWVANQKVASEIKSNIRCLFNKDKLLDVFQRLTHSCYQEQAKDHSLFIKSNF